MVDQMQLRKGKTLPERQPLVAKDKEKEKRRTPSFLLAICARSVKEKVSLLRRAPRFVPSKGFIRNPTCPGEGAECQPVLNNKVVRCLGKIEWEFDLLPAEIISYR